MALFGDAMMPFGYSGLTPDQSAMVQQQGYFFNPDAIQPGNVPWQQPAGYSNLTPDQIQAVNQQGFYTNAAAPEKSLWDKLKEGISGGGATDIQKTLDKLGAPPTPMGSALPAAARADPTMNPYFNIYRRLQIDPKAAFKALLGGGLY